MAKPLYVYTGTDWVPVASELESTSQYATTTYVDNKVGLDHLHTETFTSTATVSINDVFSATYDNYLIRARIIVSTNANINIRWRVSGADNTTSNYNTQRLTADNTSVTATRTSGGDTIQTTGITAQEFAWEWKIQNPFNTDFTFLEGVHSNGGHTQYVGSGFAATTSFTGITIYPSTGTISGTIRVYGYKN